MNLLRCLTLFVCVLSTVGFLLLQAQDTPPPAEDAPAPPGSTVITSDELRSDQNTHVSVFTGNVTVVGTNFTMTCDEMTVNFTRANKVDNIVATGSVVINQPGRVTHCGKAQYFTEDDKFVLTESPNILDNGNQIFAPEITIYRTGQKMTTQGRTRTIIVNGTGVPSTAKSTPPPSPTP